MRTERTDLSARFAPANSKFRFFPSFLFAGSRDRAISKRASTATFEPRRVRGETSSAGGREPMSQPESPLWYAITTLEVAVRGIGSYRSDGHDIPCRYPILERAARRENRGKRTLAREPAIQSWPNVAGDKKSVRFRAELCAKSRPEPRFYASRW